MVREIKRKTLLKRKIKGQERENTVHPQMNQIVIVTKIHQRAQICKKCLRMSIPHQGSLPSLQRKRINGDLANNRKSGLKPNFKTDF